MSENRPRQVYGYPTTLTATLIFLGAFVLAFFPQLFFFALKLPLLPLRYLGGYNPSSADAISLVPPGSTCNCVSTTPVELSAGEVLPAMSWFQKTLHLPAKSRGSYLITDTIVSQLPELKQYKVGILHLFVQHTSCALSMNENWDSEVREDMSDAMDRIVPEDKKGDLYRHSAEGPDDMPAHIKSALIGSSVTIPITDGKLNTGTWQGIWYLEFRAHKHSRKVVATIQGEKM